jgi:ApaG protein
MEIAITHGIQVSVSTEYQDFFSDPSNMHFAFSYAIRIDNYSEYTYKLHSRHWYIFDAIGAKYEIEGNGVVGKQPTLESGQFHEYISGCNFNAPIGQMHGYYSMERLLDGKMFEIQIPKFLMTHPSILN